MSQCLRLLLATCLLWPVTVNATLYLRFQLLSPVKTGVYASALVYTHNPPYFVSLRSMPPSGANYPAKWIKENQFSPWVEIDEAGLARDENTIILTFKSAGEVVNLRVAVDIASAPDPAAIITTRQGVTDHDLFAFLMPARPLQGQPLVTVAERSREHLQRAQKAFPGPAPQLRFLTIDTSTGGFSLSQGEKIGWSAIYRDAQVFTNELNVLRQYGFNALTSPPSLLDKYALDNGFQFVSSDCAPPIEEVYHPGYADKVAAIVQTWNDLFTRYPRAKSRVYDLRLADEPSLIGGGWGDDAAANERFREYLRGQGLSPADFGLAKWDDVKLVLTREKIGEIERLWTERQAKAAPLLYYHSKKFQSYSTWLAFKIGTDVIRKTIAPGMLTSINPSPHPVFQRGMISSNSLDWVEGGRMQAITMPWTEDWLGASGWVALNLQYTGFLCDLLRSAAKYHKSPIGMYLVPVGVNNYLATTQKTYTALGRGVTHINYFVYGPTNAATCDYYSENYDDLRAIGDATRKLVKVEQALVQAKYRQPKVAILWPVSGEIWQESNVYNTERQLLWLMCDRNQIPVDFLVEEDVESGWLDKYSVVFQVGDCLTRKASTELVAWVKRGGQLWLSPGSGLFDEYHRENIVLREISGYHPDTLQVEHNFTGWTDLLKQPKSLATVRPFDPAVPSLPVLFVRQNFLATGTVLATFSDGKPAIARSPQGKGTVWQAGFMLGFAYGAGCNKNENNGFATSFPETYAKLLDPIFAAGAIRKPVRLNQPGIQASLLESGTQTVVILTDYTCDPDHRRALTVTLDVPGCEKAKKVFSAAGAKITLSRNGDELHLALPLDISDILVIDR